ncbi:MAG: hypothetical protein WCK31_01190 [bacterium]
MPTNEISLSEIKSILLASGIVPDDKSKLETAINEITKYFKSLLLPIDIKTKDSPAHVSTILKVKTPKEESIANLYKIVLGREPNINDLSYLSSLNIQEDVLTKKMVESLEHAEIVKSRQEILVSRVNFNLIKRQYEDTSNCLKDREAILANLQNILEEKNASYEELSLKYDSLIKKLNEFKKPDERENTTTLTDRILDWFNKKFG